MSINLLMKDLPEADNFSRLPFGYQKVEYIESTGTQWINTEINGANNNLTIECKYLYQSWVSYGYLFGNYQAATYNCTRFILGQTDNSSGMGDINQIGNSSHIVITSGLNTKNTIHTLKLSRGSATFDGTNLTSTPVAGSANSYKIVLFGNNSKGTVTATKINARIYYFKIYDNNILVRDFIPCKDPNGVVCLYDTISKTSFYNSGTGNFITGPKINNFNLTTDFAKYCKSLYVENCPKVDSWNLLNYIYNYQKDHQIEIIKENIWPRVLEAVPGLSEYNLSDEYIKKICLSNDPISKGSEVLNTINGCLISYPDHPELVTDALFCIPHLTGEIKYWLCGKDALVSNKWCDRIDSNIKWDNTGCIQESNYYEVGYSLGKYFTLPTSLIPYYNLGNHFKVIFDLYVGTGGVVMDFGSVTSADKNIGFSIYNISLSMNWKMLGNNSNPGCSLSYTTELGDNIISYGIENGNDATSGKDRFTIRANDTDLTTNDIVPKVLYSGFNAGNPFYIGRPVATSSASATARIKNIIICVID